MIPCKHDHVLRFCVRYLVEWNYDVTTGYITSIVMIKSNNKYVCGTKMKSLELKDDNRTLLQSGSIKVHFINVANLLDILSVRISPTYESPR